MRTRHQNDNKEGDEDVRPMPPLRSPRKHEEEEEEDSRSMPPPRSSHLQRQSQELQTPPVSPTKSEPASRSKKDQDTNSPLGKKKNKKTKNRGEIDNAKSPSPLGKKKIKATDHHGDKQDSKQISPSGKKETPTDGDNQDMKPPASPLRKKTTTTQTHGHKDSAKSLSPSGKKKKKLPTDGDDQGVKPPTSPPGKKTTTTQTHGDNGGAKSPSPLAFAETQPSLSVSSSPQRHKHKPKVTLVPSSPSEESQPGAIAIPGLATRQQDNISSPGLPGVTAPLSPKHRLQIATAEGPVVARTESPSCPIRIASREGKSVPEPIQESTQIPVGFADSKPPAVTIRQGDSPDDTIGTYGHVSEQHDEHDPELPIEASLVTDSISDEDIANQIAERVRLQIEEQYEQRRKEEEARRPQAVTAVKVASDARLARKGTPGASRDDGSCCLGLSRCIVLGAIAGFLLIAAATGVVVTLVLGPDDPPPTETPTQSPTLPPFTISPTPPPPTSPPTSPPTDTPPKDCPPFTSATNLDYDPSGISVLGSTLGAPSNMPLSACSSNAGSPTLWYRFKYEGTTEGAIIVTTCSPTTNFDTLLAVFLDVNPSGENCNSIICVESNDDHVLWDTNLCNSGSDTMFVHSAVQISGARPNDVYYVAVSGYIAAEAGSFELRVLTLGGSGQQADCPFSNAVPLFHDPEFTVTQYGSTVGAPATIPDNDWFCGLTPGSPTAWYVFEPETVGAFLLYTCSIEGITTFNTVLGVYLDSDPFGQTTPDTCGDSIECVGWNDDHNLEDTFFCGGASGVSSAVEFVSNSVFDKFYIAVTSFSDTDSGSFQLNLQTLSRVPAFEECPLDTAIPIAYDAMNTATTTVFGSTVGAIANIPMTPFDECTMASRSPTVWYQFQTDIEATILITTCSSDGTLLQDTVLAVFQRSEGGGNCDLICVAGNDDSFQEFDSGVCSGSSLKSAVEIVSRFPLDTFYIAVSSFDPNDSGDFVLRLITTWL